MLDAMLKGLFIGLLLSIAVGPVLFSVIKQSVNHGRRGGFSFALGVWISDIVWVVLSNGFSEGVKELIIYKKPIGLAGSMFLIAIGIYYLFLKKAPTKKEENIKIAGDVITSHGKRTNYFAITTSGFLLNTLNPAIMSFWVFIAASLATYYSLLERVVIFSIAIGLNILADTGKVFGAGYLGNKLSTKNIMLINRISGLLYMVFGVLIIVGIFLFSKKS